jgi:hypothetical protein
MLEIGTHQNTLYKDLTIKNHHVRIKITQGRGPLKNKRPPGTQDPQNKYHPRNKTMPE